MNFTVVLLRILCFDFKIFLVVNFRYSKMGGIVFDWPLWLSLDINTVQVFI